MQSAKETAQNVAATAKSGMEKTKATMQEKAEKMTTRDPLQKELAAEKKEERIHQAELEKQQARQQHAATRQAASGGGMFGTTGGEYTTTTGAGVGAGHTGVGTGHTAGMGTTTRPVEGMGGGQYPEGQLEDPNVPGGRRTGYGTGGGAI